MEALVISPDFTIEDIHKERENNFRSTNGKTMLESEAQKFFDYSLNKGVRL